MFKRLRAAWGPLKRSPPGKRFQHFHAARKKERKGRPWRFLVWAGGIGLIVCGVVLLPAPGPGWLVIIGGIALLAQESLWLARGLDSLEVWIRKKVPGGWKPH